jgi:hypothetical protein
MITRYTVFILGAGASHPYGLPSGEGLVKMIVGKLNPTPAPIGYGLATTKSLKSPEDDHLLRMIYEASGNPSKEPDALENFRKRLEESKDRSIDTFLQYNDTLFPHGKRAIAAILLQCESHRNILDPPDDKKGHDWYPLLKTMLKARHEDFYKNRVAFITYNYDRSLEEFLFTTFTNQEVGSVSEAEWASTLRANIPIIHLHGKLGEHPAFVDPAKGEKAVEYGAPLTAKSIHSASEGIRIVHEDIREEDKVFREAYKVLNQAECICFLGFGYDPINLMRLKLQTFTGPRPRGNNRVAGTRIIGTTLGKTPAERKRIAADSNGSIDPETLGSSGFDCVQFIRNNDYLQSGIYEAAWS